ncbi:MAG: polysaccharide biosynthesis/export family protein [bacterium]
MRSFSMLWLIFISVSLFAQTGDNQANSPASYRLGPGDELVISVYGEPELSPQLKINDNGVISYPFLGDIVVSGKTTDEVDLIITEGLKKGYLVKPVVSVHVTDYRPFYINGQVANPNSYPYRPGLTVRQAISVAGGFTERASKNKVFMIPEGKASDEASKVDLDQRVNPGDTIIVRESFF